MVLRNTYIIISTVDQIKEKLTFYNMSIQILLLIGFVFLVKAQTIRRDSCPHVDVKQDFDVNRYLGKWYELERSFAILELGLECTTAEYGLQEDGTITILNKGIRRDGTESSLYGIAKFSNSSDVGKLLIKFESFPFETDYWVLDTDYINYSIVFSCANVLIVHSENLWILTRQPALPADILNNIYRYLDANGIYRKGLSAVNHNCNQTAAD